MAKGDMRKGGGGRFKKLEHSIEEREGYSKDRAKAAAAAIGRKRYGKKGMARMAAAGRHRAASRRHGHGHSRGGQR